MSRFYFQWDSREAKVKGDINLGAKTKFMKVSPIEGWLFLELFFSVKAYTVPPKFVVFLGGSCTDLISGRPGQIWVTPIEASQFRDGWQYCIGLYMIFGYTCILSGALLILRSYLHPPRKPWINGGRGSRRWKTLGNPYSSKNIWKLIFDFMSRDSIISIKGPVLI